jgi:hypothetical protein
MRGEMLLLTTDSASGWRYCRSSAGSPESRPQIWMFGELSQEG